MSVHQSTDDKVAELVSCAINNLAGSIANFLNDCESPIERLFAATFVDSGQSTGWSEPQDAWPPRDFYEAWSFEYGGGRRWSLVVQYKVSAPGGEYRVDFAMLCGDAKVAVECDGHDFHERTKEQARRDKKRDRDLTAAGWTVVRFAGSEIWRDPYGCARQAMSIMFAKSGWSED